MENDKELEKSLHVLKDFQRKTVERIYNVLSDKEKVQNRFLVADEVGLGKTLIAKGVITIFAMALGKNEKIKVVYLCSNTTIANQNIRKLQVFQDSNMNKFQDGFDSRLTMLPIKNEDETGIINYIPLTPGTSFKVTSGGGRLEERVLIVKMLSKIRKFSPYKKEIEELFRLRVSKANWEYYLANFNGKINKDIQRSFEEEIINDERLLNKLREGFKNYRRKGNEPAFLGKIIGRLRHIIVKVSVASLKPDIVILDEFQRFKELLKSEEEEEEEEEEIDDVQVVANKFFENPNQKIILLSATPYKLYSTSRELEEGESHYKEFMQVISFLLNDEVKLKEFEALWEEYNKIISNLKTASKEEGILAKNKVESFLKNIMCRTERILVSKSGNALLDTSKSMPLTINGKDIEGFISVDKVSEELEALGDRVYSPMELYKSSPFMYSFMDSYKLKKSFQRNLKVSKELQAIVKKNPKLFINKDQMAKYKKLEYCSSKFDKVVEEVFEYNGQNLLWVPPSMPYYKLEGPFENTENFSKSLIFSSWEMVPRMMATLLSYESERTTIGELIEGELTEDGEKESRKNYFASGAKRFPKRRLNFSLNNKRMDGIKANNMSNLVLMYPSEYLCEVVDPKENIRKKLSLEELLKKVEVKIVEDINKCSLDKYVAEDSKIEDRGWYYIAPVLLDRKLNYVNTSRWFDNIQKLSKDDKENRTAIFEHLSLLEKIFGSSEFNTLGRMPKDLPRVLSIMALSSPAVIAKRMLKGIIKSEETLKGATVDNIAYTIGNEFRLKFAESESVGILDSYYKDKEVYWRKVLRYSLEGNLQSVLDEYMYLLY